MKLKVIFNTRQLLGQFVEVLDTDSRDNKVLRKLLNERLKGMGYPKVTVREIYYMEDVPEAPTATK